MHIKSWISIKYREVGKSISYLCFDIIIIILFIFLIFYKCISKKSSICVQVDIEKYRRVGKFMFMFGNKLYLLNIILFIYLIF